MLDSRIVEALVRPASQGTDLSSDEEELLQMLAEGKPIKAIPVPRRTTPADADDALQRLFLKLAQPASGGGARALAPPHPTPPAAGAPETEGRDRSRGRHPAVPEKTP